ncbi:MAG: pyridoxal-phosphate dependent enzyme, partial [Alphaproteobacteria bacterium]|nr:pyridoxal-phosphate dependent enzyme [Alphaproteobacteria bacterium]
KKDVRIMLADPCGSALHNFYAHGKLKAEGDSITEGIGQGRITKNLEDTPIDGSMRIGDEEALKVIFDLVRHEGFVVGGSSGINVAGAIRLAEEMGPGHTVVTILADDGAKYQSKIFNPAFLKEKNLPIPEWLNSK